MPYGGITSGRGQPSAGRPNSPNGRPYDPNIPDWMIPGYGTTWGAGVTGAGGAGGGTTTTVQPGEFGGSNADIIGRVTSSRDPEQLLPDLLNMGFGISEENTRRRQETLGWMRGQFDAANRPTLTDQDVRRFESRESDRLAGGSQQQMRDLRAFMGSAGITGGGMPTALAAQTELARMANLTGARRDLRIQKAQTDALDRANQFMRTQPIMELMNEPADMVGLDTMTSALEYRSDRYGYDQQRAAAEAQARATRSAGRDSMWGSIFSGFLGGLGGL